VATIVHIVIVVLLIELLGFGHGLQAAIAFSFAAFISYRVNHLWTFATTGPRLECFPKFYAVAIAGASTHAGITYLIGGCIGYWYVFAITVGIFIATPLTFAAKQAMDVQGLMQDPWHT